ncbi:P-loop NTPase fold protein [Hoeflea sp. EC-HK425]|uniref:P-loop NTPase fold protein n=1 Tax=Hoeflea sp. EC-HK425 TaxID=2038388 RepID=UPI001255E848|nr:P-loop NTPase fold protein [Hoeflea sp. EC-HK425]VVT12295.1 hypothetical protein HOE425_330714 [Hoeflea sp. EC-HK425]
MGQTHIKFRTIPDDPAKEDEFSGQGHKRTAGVLARLIQDFDGTDKSIGLEGNWGAGKSSIIRMASDSLQRNKTAEPADKKSEGFRKTFHFYTFDLWRHQTSHFRRSFLESLTKWMMENCAKTERDDFEKVLSGLQNKTREITTDKHRNLSLFGIIAVFFVISLPILYTWLSPFAVLNSDKNFVINPITMAFLVVLAIMIAGVFWEAHCIKKNHNKSVTADKEISHRQAVSRALGLFSNDSQYEKISQEIRDIDPTDYEFTKTFRKLLSLFQSDERRLVVVFDNIDRLPSDRIADAWSNIRAVFAGEETFDPINGELEDPNSTVTAIVPYDRAHIVNSLNPRAERAIVARNPSEEQLALYMPNEDEGRYQQQDLLRKTFDTILNVAPPVLSDRAAYFQQKINYAVSSGADEDTMHRTYQVFHERLLQHRVVVTPRHIISFINQTVSLWAQWNDEIPMPTVAIYVLHRDKIDRDPNSLLDPMTISSDYRLAANDPNLDRNLAALAFNVPSDHAEQLLLADPIEGVLTADWSESEKENSGEPVELKKLREAPGFSHMITAVARDKAGNWARHSATRFRNVVQNLNMIGCSGAVTRTAKKRILEAFNEVKPIRPKDWSAHTGLLALYEFCETENEVIKLSQLFSHWLSVRPENTKEDNGYDEGAFLAEFVGALKHTIERSHDETMARVAMRQIRVPTNYEHLIGFAADASENDLDINDLAPYQAPENFTAELTKEITENPLMLVDAWPQINSKVSQPDQLSLIKASIAHLQKTDLAEDPQSYAALLQTLYAWGYIGLSGKNKQTAKQAIQGLVADGALSQIGQKDLPGDDAGKIIAYTLWFHLDAHPNFKLPAVDLTAHQLGNLTTGREWVQRTLLEGNIEPDALKFLAQICIAQGKMSQLIKSAAEAPKTSELAQQIILEATNSLDLAPPALNSVLPNYQFLKELTGESIEKWLVVIGQMPPEDWSDIDLLKLDSALVQDIADRNESGWEYVREQYDKRLLELTQEEWQEILTKNTRVKIIAESRIESGLRFDPAIYQTPLLDYLEQVLNGQISENLNWDGLSSGLKPNLRRVVASQLLTRAKDTEIQGENIVRLARTFPQQFSLFPFDEQPDITIQKFVMPLLMLDDLSDIKAIYEDMKKSLRTALKLAKETSIGALEEMLETIDEADSEVKKDNAIWWRSLLGMPKKKSRSTKPKSKGE